MCTPSQSSLSQTNGFEHRGGMWTKSSPCTRSMQSLNFSASPCTCGSSNILKVSPGTSWIPVLRSQFPPSQIRVNKANVSDRSEEGYSIRVNLLRCEYPLHTLLFFLSISEALASLRRRKPQTLVKLAVNTH